jgi:lipooligosaccharide transport system permease protein
VVLVPVIGVVTGFGFALLGIFLSSVVPSIDSFGYIISAVITPLFLLAGTFFPLENLAGWVAAGAQANPLYHCVELVRACVFGFSGWGALWHVAGLAAFAAAAWAAATLGMRRALID